MGGRRTWFLPYPYACTELQYMVYGCKLEVGVDTCVASCGNFSVGYPSPITIKCLLHALLLTVGPSCLSILICKVYIHKPVYQSDNPSLLLS